MTSLNSKPEARPPRTKEQIQEGAKAIAYEAKMLFQISELWTCRVLVHPIFSELIIESFLVHFRNLREFLYPSNPSLCDIIASDFSPAAWGFVSSDWTETVPEERARIDERLSLPSYSRHHLTKRWPVQKMASAVLERLTQFLQTLPNEERSLFHYMSDRQFDRSASEHRSSGR
jgi:hypothetical protein